MLALRPAGCTERRALAERAGGGLWALRQEAVPEWSGSFPAGRPWLRLPPVHSPSRHSPLVQFNLLHSKFHLCSVPTRALLLSTYIKFINLFPETKATIQGVLRAGSQLRNADVELQQRAVEYLTLSSVASTDVLVRARSPPAPASPTLCLTLPFLLTCSRSPTPQATVLEEMPPFPERESSILAKLKRKKGPGAASALDDGRRDPSSSDINGGVEPTPSTVVSPPGLGHWEGSPGVSFLPMSVLPAVDALTLRRPPGAAGSPSSSGTPGSLWCRQPPGGRLLRWPSCPAQPGAHP